MYRQAILPSEDDFYVAFDVIEGEFTLLNGSRVDVENLSVSVVYRWLVAAACDWEDGDDAAGAWVSSVLALTGFDPGRVLLSHKW